MKNEEQKSQDNNTSHLGACLSIGICLGVGFGIALGNLAFGIGIGICLGSSIGTILDQQTKK